MAESVALFRSCLKGFFYKKLSTILTFFLVILFHSASPVKHFVMVLHLNCMTKRRTWNYFIMDMQLWPPSHWSNHFLLLTWMCCLHVFGGLIEKQAMPFTKIISILCLLLKLSRFTMEIKMITMMLINLLTNEHLKISFLITWYAWRIYLSLQEAHETQRMAKPSVLISAHVFFY